jgi:hypothetical protein
VGNTLDTVQFPYPFAAAIRPALAKVLWIEPDNLKQQVPVLIMVVIDRDNFPLSLIPPDEGLFLEPLEW